jgi:hypothetical protein
MRERQMRVVRCVFVASGLMMLRRLTVMARSACMMFGCVCMVFGSFR